MFFLIFLIFIVIQLQLYAFSPLSPPTPAEPKEKSKQNTTRDIEVGNSLAVARGEWGGDSGKRGLQ